MADSNIVALEDVSVIYEGERVPAIHDISLIIPPGEFVTILGPNGSGKTTLLETINGLLETTSGMARVFGLEAGKHGCRIRRRTAYVIQNFSLDPLDPFLSRDVVMMGRSGRIGMLRFPGPSDWGAVDEALTAVEMQNFADRPVGKLSGGEFQRILLARAMAQDPDLLLLDEPLANLDVDARENIQGILREWHRSREVTMVMVSHDVTGIPDYCDRTVVMDRGRILMDGSRDEVLASPLLPRLFTSLGDPR